MEVGWWYDHSLPFMSHVSFPRHRFFSGSSRPTHGRSVEPHDRLLRHLGLAVRQRQLSTCRPGALAAAAARRITHGAARSGGVVARRSNYCCVVGRRLVRRSGASDERRRAAALSFSCRYGGALVVMADGN